MQCGGWTIEWQGKMGNITSGTTILEGIKSEISDNSKVTYSADGLGGNNADIGIVVIGEKPYAEGIGDNEHLNLSDEDLLEGVWQEGNSLIKLVDSLYIDQVWKNFIYCIFNLWGRSMQGLMHYCLVGEQAL